MQRTQVGSNETSGRLVGTDRTSGTDYLFRVHTLRTPTKRRSEKGCLSPSFPQSLVEALRVGVSDPGNNK
jgi:hypothetical protein